MTGTEPSLGKRIALGAFWMILLRFSLRGIGLISMIILARILAPADFGLVALAVSAVAFLDLMAEFSFDMALIQRQDATRRHYDTAWTMLVLKSVILAVVLVLSAGLIADFFDEPRLRVVLYAVAAAVVFEGFQNIGVVDFRKELTFEKEFRFYLVPKLMSFTVTIVLAVQLENYWALVAGILTERLARCVASYVLHPFRPRFSLGEFANLFSFSKWMLLSNISGFLAEKADTFVIGRLLNTASVGLYTVSLEIARLPTTDLIWPLMRVVYPAYSKISNDRANLSEYYLQIAGIVVAMAIPVVCGIVMLAPDLVPIFLGDRWLGAVPLIQILAAYGFLRALGLNSYSVFMATDRSWLVAIVAAGNAAGVLVAAVIGIRLAGVIGVAYGVAIASAIFALVSVGIVMSLLKIPLGRLIALVWRPLISAALMVGFIYGTLDAIVLRETILERISTIMVLVMLSAVIYIASAYGQWGVCGRPAGPEKILLDALVPAAKKLSGKFRRTAGQEKT